MNSKKKKNAIDPNAFGDTINAQDDINDVIPPNEEYYTLNLNRTQDEDSDIEGVDITATDNEDMTKSSSFYEGKAVTSGVDEDDVIDTDLGGATKNVLDEDTTSAEVGQAGHQGDDPE